MNTNHEEKLMDDQSVSHRKAELDQRLEDIKADKYYIRKHFGEKIKMTAALIFARNSDEFLAEIERQNKKIMEGTQ
jgi:hypothetical protein